MNTTQYYRNNTELETRYPHENAVQRTIDVDSLWYLESEGVVVLDDDDFFYAMELDNHLFYKVEI